MRSRQPRPSASGGGERAAIRLAALLFAMLLVGCSQPESTRLRAEDFDFTIRKMADSLAGSALLNDRGPESPPMVIAINRVENLTTDLIPLAEQWQLVQRVRGSLPMQQLAREKNVRFQLRPERLDVVEQLGFEVDTEAAPQPTHVMSAVFMSSPRTVVGGDADERYVQRRADYYYLEYTIRDLRGREVVWSETFEFKREAAGLAID